MVLNHWFFPKRRGNKFKIYLTENKDKNHYDLFVPENILSPNHRRELRIRISFNSRDKNEGLACMNRYWFNTNNNSRFSIIRIRMYPRLKIR
ncbi:hypothetical protein V6Z11_D13G044200 [Gossypium hirsutum]